VSAVPGAALAQNPAGAFGLTKTTGTQVDADTLTPLNLVNVVAASGTAQTLIPAGNDITLSGNLVAAMPPVEAGATCYAIIRQSAGGGDTCTFTGVKWAGGSAPVISTAANAVDIFQFISDATHWYGITVGQAFA
jgi:hypothetical protein